MHYQRCFLLEGKPMYKGIFWIVDEENLHNNDRYLIKIETDIKGTILDYDLPLNSRNGDNYAHKETWKILPYELSRNKPFNYFPRGRVEIRNGKCTIFLNPSINKEEIVEYLKEQFELNDFDLIRIVADHSNHYKARLGK